MKTNQEFKKQLFLRNYSTRLFAWLFIITNITFLNGCGFHLKGLDNVGKMQCKSVQLVKLEGVRLDIQQVLRSQLQGVGVQVVESIVDAEIQITFKPTVYKVTRTAYSGQGDTTDQLLSMSQSFKATWVGSGRLIVADSVRVLRDRQVEPTVLLAANRELASIQAEMAERLAMQILTQIYQTVLKQKDTKVNPNMSHQSSQIPPKKVVQ